MSVQCSLGAAPSWGVRTAGQREGLNSYSLSKEASGAPRKVLELGWPLRDVADGGIGAGPLYLCPAQSWKHNLGKGGQCPGMDSAVSHQQGPSQQLGKCQPQAQSGGSQALHHSPTKTFMVHFFLSFLGVAITCYSELKGHCSTRCPF